MIGRRRGTTKGIAQIVAEIDLKGTEEGPGANARILRSLTASFSAVEHFRTERPLEGPQPHACRLIAQGGPRLLRLYWAVDPVTVMLASGAIRRLIVPGGRSQSRTVASAPARGHGRAIGREGHRPDQTRVVAKGYPRLAAIDMAWFDFSIFAVTTAGWLGSSWRQPASPRCGSLGSGGVVLRTSTPATLEV